MNIVKGEVESSVISESCFLFGQAMNVSDSLASGLNLLLLVMVLIEDTHQTALHIQVHHTSFVNNKGQYRNFF